MAWWFLTVTDCSHRAITMLLILVEVCESGLSVNDSHRAITMLLILVKVSVKVACQSTRAKTAGIELSQCYLL